MTVPKLAGTGFYPAITEFYAHGFWIQVGRGACRSSTLFRVTLYARYEQRHAQFPDAPARRSRRSNHRWGERRPGREPAVKAEYLVNQELEGAPQVANNVFTSSAVWTW